MTLASRATELRPVLSRCNDGKEKQCNDDGAPSLRSECWLDVHPPMVSLRMLAGFTCETLLGLAVHPCTRSQPVLDKPSSVSSLPLPVRAVKKFETCGNTA